MTSRHPPHITFSSHPKMATNPLQSLHHHHSLLKLQSIDTTPPSSLFLKPSTPSISTSNINTPLSLTLSSSYSATTTFSISPTTSTASPSTTSQSPFSLDLLHQYLSTQNFRQADEETRRLLILLSGEAAQKRGYVFFSEVQFIAENDLKAIDELWKKYSNKKFGYSVQKRIWKQKENKDFTKFFLRVGWMKKLETEVEQYNYRSFPNEFIWELNDDTPEGHLPLTNALRGTQLLTSILNHPAFDQEDEEAVVDDADDDQNGGELKKGRRDSGSSEPLSKTVFKPDYSF